MFGRLPVTSRFYKQSKYSNYLKIYVYRSYNFRYIAIALIVFTFPLSNMCFINFCLELLDWYTSQNMENRMFI